MLSAPKEKKKYFSKGSRTMHSEMENYLLKGQIFIHCKNSRIRVHFTTMKNAPLFSKHRNVVTCHTTFNYLPFTHTVKGKTVGTHQNQNSPKPSPQS